MTNVTKKAISIEGKNLEYGFRRSRRAKRLRVSVACNGTVTLTLPWFVPVSAGETFLRIQAGWVFRKLEEMAGRKQPILSGIGKREYRKRRNEALAFVTDRVEYWNRFYGFSYGRISVRDQKTRWGSCSKTGNLSFNWKLLLLPSEMADYVVVHELCHLAEHNHSPAFWFQVDRTTPDYRDIRRRMRKL